MPRTQQFFLVVLTGFAFLLPGRALTGQQSTDSQPATIRVYVPADAKITVDGTPTKQTGGDRRYVSPPLSLGKKYVYTFRATWQDQGKAIVREKEVQIEGGKETTVDLRQEEAQPAGKVNPDLDREPDVVYWPTPQPVVDKMLELAEIKKGDVIYDLGCGDARILVTAAKKYGARGFGFDIDPQRVKESIENVKKNKVEDLVTIKRADVFTLDLKDATVVTLYLLPQLNVKLLPQLAKLKPGSRIVSHDFDMKGAKPNQVVRMRAKNHMGMEGEHLIYLWIVPWEKE
jgi:uncharacterized protein (TIGR03000 family)